MRFVRFMREGRAGLAVERHGQLRGLGEPDLHHSTDLADLLRSDQNLVEIGKTLLDASAIDPETITYLPPLVNAQKIICVGLNYADHTKESPYDQPDYPTLFPRFASSLIGHNQAIVRPLISDSLDFEGELVAVIGKGGRHISRRAALDHVAGYSIFNDGSVREYQFKSPQWTVGKNFDGTGAFGPYFVTADEVPAGGKGLRLETRLNGTVVQSASTDDMLFDVAEVISVVSEAITLVPGDVIVTGTPAGIGWARTPRLIMRNGDVCEVEIEGLGILRNPVVDEAQPARAAA